jgi:hypothetical protein
VHSKGLNHAADGQLNEQGIANIMYFKVQPGVCVLTNTPLRAAKNENRRLADPTTGEQKIQRQWSTAARQ